jgi:hypothetical protein
MPSAVASAILAALAEFERERIRERVRAGLSRVKAAGRRLGRPERQVAEPVLAPVRGLPAREAALDASPTYRVALGVLVVLGSSAQGWDRAGVLGPPFERLARSTLMKDATFKEWYERARANQR